jgi:RNA polymerase sigma-70 factor, ECF subfamily
MEHLHHLTDKTSRVSRNISIRAARLARSGAAPGMDAEDIAQELRLDLIRRAAAYDPAKASFETFADRIVANRIASLAATTHASRADRIMQSLDAPAGSEDGDNSLTLADVLPETHAMHPGDEFVRTHGPGLRGDIGKLLAALCPASRRVAIAVSHLSVAETARSLGLHRSSVYERLASIRETAVDLGLGEYFEASPTVTAARR